MEEYEMVLLYLVVGFISFLLFTKLDRNNDIIPENDREFFAGRDGRRRVERATAVACGRALATR